MDLKAANKPSKDLQTKMPRSAVTSGVVFDEALGTPRYPQLSITMQGDAPGPGEWNFMTFFNDRFIVEAKWNNGATLEVDELPMNLKEPEVQQIFVDKPVIFILRIPGTKSSKEPDPLMHLDNRAGANVDMSPLVLGEEEIFVEVPLLMVPNGEMSTCKVVFHATCTETLSITQVPLMITLVSAHCLPVTKDGTVYVGALSLDNIVEPVAVNFGLSLSTPTAEKIVWATASTGALIGNTLIYVPEEDKHIPQDFEPQDTPKCISVYWNAMKRVLVDPIALQERLSVPFLFEIAGVPKTGKTDVRGRYMGLVDAGVLLEPGQFGVTTCVNLNFYSEAKLPENVNPVLELPPSSAKASARDTEAVLVDEYGHKAYAVIRFDVIESLVAKSKIGYLFETIGFPPPEGGTCSPMVELHIEAAPDDPMIDVTRIRVEGGALAVHKELSSLACRGLVPMNQSIKRTAANRLLMRVRSMLKQFPPGDCSYIEWQDTVTGQHAASRRAVTASFAPQPPALRPSSRTAPSRCRTAGDTKIAKTHIEHNLKFAPNHPWPLLSKALLSLEFREDRDAANYILRALSNQTRNKFLLWVYGAQEFDKGEESIDIAKAAFRIAVKGDYSDGTSNAIGWAALHTVHHYDNCHYAAFVAAKKMRKSYELQKEWKKFLNRWTETSGQEEVFWIPSVVSSQNPMLIAAAFFLCLRCYKFSELILKCYDNGCSTRGSYRNLTSEVCADVYYLRIASLLLRRQYDRASAMTEKSIKLFGPVGMLCQMRLTCKICASGWDGACESELQNAESAGAELCPSLLLQAALGGMNIDPHAALQRAARAHKVAPGGHSALVIGRIFAKLGDRTAAERWAAAAVKVEPLLADGWAFLAIMAMYDRKVDKARTMLRTARQVGNVSEDIEDQLKKAMDISPIDALPDAMVKKLCFCNYLN